MRDGGEESFVLSEDKVDDKAAGERDGVGESLLSTEGSDLSIPSTASGDSVYLPFLFSLSLLLPGARNSIPPPQHPRRSSTTSPPPCLAATRAPISTSSWTLSLDTWPRKASVMCMFGAGTRTAARGRLSVSRQLAIRDWRVGGRGRAKKSRIVSGRSKG